MTDFDALFDDAVRQGVTPGGQAWVMHRGRTVLRRCFGILGPEGPPVSESTPYDLASLTKVLVTAPLFHRSVDLGRIDPNEPVSQEFPGMDPGIRFHHLLEHDSGLPAHRPLGLQTRAAPPLAAHRAIVAQAASVPPHDFAGRRSVYSDLGFILLGAALERRNGLWLSRWLSHVGAPLRFADGRCAAGARIDDAAPTSPDLQGVVHDDNARRMGGCAGHAGAFGTAEQVGAWIRRMLDDDSLVSGRAWERMGTPSPTAGSSRTSGWDRPLGPRTTAPGWPQDTIGHLGYTGTSVWLHPPTRTAAVLLTNRTRYSENPIPIRSFRQQFHHAVAQAWGFGRSSTRNPHRLR